MNHSADAHIMKQRIDTSQPDMPCPSVGETDQQVSPWRRALRLVLIGLALNMFQFQFLLLDMILPTLGLILMLLGFRTLRAENHAFQACWILSTVQVAWQFCYLFASGTIWREEVIQRLTSPWPGMVGILLMLIQLIFLRQGFYDAQKKSGLTIQTRDFNALILWYFLLTVLALAHFSGWWFFIIAILLLFGFILRGIYRLVVVLDEAGYIPKVTPKKWNDHWVLLGLLIILAAGLTTCFVFFGKYPMEWSPLDNREQTATAAERQKIVALGVPENLVYDLSPADCHACAGANRAEVWDASCDLANPWISPAAKGNALYCTTIMVELPEKEDTWRVIHHFRWDDDTRFYGTEGIKLDLPRNFEDGWGLENNFHGRLLYEDGQTFIAPFYVMEERVVSDNTMIIGGQFPITNYFAGFSFPNGKTNCRGYLSFDVQSIQGKSPLASYFTYCHHTFGLQYPVKTAVSYLTNTSPQGVFQTAYVGGHFNPGQEEAEE